MLLAGVTAEITAITHCRGSLLSEPLVAVSWLALAGPGWLALAGWPWLARPVSALAGFQGWMGPQGACDP